MPKQDTILTINVVEPELVRAVGLHAKTLGRDLKGLVLVDAAYADYSGRPKDGSGLFEEVVCDFDDPDALQTALKPYADRLLAATCRYEEAIQPFAKVIPFLPYLYTPSETVLEWSTEKPLMRDRLRNYDAKLVPRYQYLEAQDLPRLSTLIQDFSFPVIVKPSGLSKSLLVSRCETKAELKDCLKHTFKLVHHAYEREHYPGKPSVLVEEVMHGDMYSLDAYVMHDGQIFCLPPVKVTTAHSLGLPGFYGFEGMVPTGLSKAEVQAANAAAKAAIKALNLRSTTAHIELFRTNEGWKIIEVAARIGGHRDVLYREVYGIEHFYNDLAVRMGQKPVMPGKPTKHGIFLNMYAEDEGYIEAIQGIKEARQLESVVYLAEHAGPGDLALFASNGGDVIVEGVLSHEDPDQLRADINQVRRLVKINLQTA